MVNTKSVLPIVALLPVLIWSGSIRAESDDTLDVLLDGGKVSLDFRYRYEFVDQEGFTRNANASTLRTRLGFQSGVWRGWDFDIEFNDVRQLLANNFNAGGGTTPNRTEYPVVPDPKGTRLNQGYLNYTGIEDWGFKVGRQRINVDNQRFVGSVGWRQTEQVFDAGEVSWDAGPAQVSLTYVEWVRRVFGPDSPVGSARQDGTFFVHGNLDTAVGPLAGYYYHIDDRDSPAFSTDSVGIRLTGSRKVNQDWKIRYEGEYAHQTDAGSNPVDYSADYLHLAAGILTGPFDLGIGWEMLGGNDNTLVNESFRTPLATLHKFNGWADQFLVTPAAGLSDAYLAVAATPGNWIAQASLHRFDAEDGGEKFGTEIDLQVGYAYNDHFRSDFFLADFNGDNGLADVTKIWVQLLLRL
ncbi:MAG: alginate export family protein [Pseudomonadales bacterium]|jgi:hypothetical protein